jgi:hypothetical protein
VVVVVVCWWWSGNDGAGVPMKEVETVHAFLDHEFL